MDLTKREIALARKSFWHFVRLMFPFWKWYKHHRLICDFCQDWLDDKFQNGMIHAPPRHNKSQIISIALPAYIMGKHAERLNAGTEGADHPLLMVCGNSNKLTKKFNIQTKALMRKSRYLQVFPWAELPDGKTRDGTSRIANNEEFQLQDKRSRAHYISNSVGSTIVGDGFTHGIVDDPIEGREQANSPTQLDKIYDWMTSDFISRKNSPAAKILIMHQRWNEQDPAGRLAKDAKNNPDALAWEKLYLPAIMKPELERYRYHLDTRKYGEALCPERWPVSALRPFMINKWAWDAMYQQCPVTGGTRLFDETKWGFVDEPPERVAYRCWFWDLSGTEKGDPWCGVLASKDRLGVVYIEDCIHGNWSPADGEAAIIEAVERTGLQVPVYFEEEKGGSGKLTTDHFRRIVLPGYQVHASPVKGDKRARAKPYAGQQAAGNVKLVRGAWNRAFIDEHSDFPRVKHDDRVDAASGGYMILAAKKAVGKPLVSRINVRKTAV